ncbi:MAG TPA: DUF1501 domain-containing protein [Candidatus Saccharimonadales bacterium]|nr:DUF1501 domain-containing protein [Candidatus Saccharimonadales bacterium]
MKISRRNFLQTGALAAAGLALPSSVHALDDVPVAPVPAVLTPTADAMIMIWLPGGMAQTDLWDPKKYTPYQKGMKGSELLGTCKPIPTSADGIFLGEGLENIASVMHHGSILRSLSYATKFGAIHLKAQYYMMTGYLFPVGVKAPSIGAVVARSLGRRHAEVPPYIYIGRDIDTSDAEKMFISEYLGPGFYGVNYAPFMIPEPSKGLSTLNAVAGMKMDRLDRRQEYLRAITGAAEKELQESNKVKDYMKVMEQARAMMDSPIQKTFDYAKEEKPEILKAYQPKITAEQQLDPKYYHGNRFGEGCLLARRMVEAGARYVQVEYQYGPFKGFDMHENGRERMIEMKKQIDGPIAQLIRDLHDRGLLKRTLVCIATEFGRTIASAPSAGVEPEGDAERHTGENLVIDSERMYGFHGHFSSGNQMLFFGGGFKGGYVHGKTAGHHPMVPIENPVPLTDVHATIYKALGIPADQSFTTEARPFYVTENGQGKAINALLA